MRWVRGVDWPVLAGVVLGLAALIEVALQAEETGPNLVTPLLLVLASTVPLALIRTHLWAAAVTLAAASALTVLLYRRPAIAGVVALAAALYLLGRRLVQRLSREAVEREATRQAVEQQLLAYAARGERARIARELHDVVAHHISMISVQAETARLTTPDLPPEGAKRLLAIGDTARAALAEMRRLLGVLREDAGGEPSRAPQPGLRQLVDLVDEARDSASTCTRLIVRGTVTALGPGTELAAYRIVQEALTNARRHAPGAAVDVELDYGEEALRVRVRDNGPGPVSNGEGLGLLGMRERVAAAGGELSVGPAPLAGFLVEATLPRSEGWPSG